MNIPQTWHIFGLVFHTYGLLVGVAIGVMWWLWEQLIRQQAIPLKATYPWLLGMAVGAVIGARGWHVVTDWELYAHDWSAAFFIWRGGLSIVGALVGGAVGSWLASRYVGIVWQNLTDIAVLVLPFGQAVGRLGNYVNQEVYGVPTTLPWGIFISPDHRVAGFQQLAYYHPLFAYEALALLCWGVLMWRWASTPQAPRSGTGFWTAAYVAFYGTLRFGLEFLRLEKSLAPGKLGEMGWGVNQLVMGVIAVVAVGWLLRNRRNVFQKI